MRFVAQTKFWQLPFTIKLAVIWLLLLSFSSFWRLISRYIETRSAIDLGSILFGFIYWGLAVGLINKSNESRAWAAFVTFLGSLAWLFAFAIAIFEDSDLTKGLEIQSSLPHTQEIIFAGALLIINVGILFILMRPATKALFASQTKPEYEQ